MATRDEVESALWKTLSRFGLHEYAQALADTLEGFEEFEEEEEI